MEEEAGPQQDQALPLTPVSLDSGCPLQELAHWSADAQAEENPRTAQTPSIQGPCQAQKPFLVTVQCLSSWQPACFEQPTEVPREAHCSHSSSQP